MAYINSRDIKKCSNVICELLKEKNIIFSKDVLSKITIDVMNISYAKGGDYSEKIIKCFAEVYIEDGLYKKFL
mgnify:CR=1 FL=1